MKTTMNKRELKRMKRKELYESSATSTERENQRISMRIDLEVLDSVDHIITTITSDSECVSVSVNSNFGIRH